MAASAHLTRITRRAKQIRKEHPKKKWTECIKAASKELHKPGAKTKRAPAKRVIHKRAPVKKHLSRCHEPENTYMKPFIKTMLKLINKFGREGRSGQGVWVEIYFTPKDIKEMETFIL